MQSSRPRRRRAGTPLRHLISRSCGSAAGNGASRPVADGSIFFPLWRRAERNPTHAAADGVPPLRKRQGCGRARSAASSHEAGCPRVCRCEKANRSERVFCAEGVTDRRHAAAISANGRHTLARQSSTGTTTCDISQLYRGKLRRAMRTNSFGPPKPPAAPNVSLRPVKRSHHLFFLCRDRAPNGPAAWIGPIFTQCVLARLWPIHGPRMAQLFLTCFMSMPRPTIGPRPNRPLLGLSLLNSSTTKKVQKQRRT
jgi:hypothetical protein